MKNLIVRLHSLIIKASYDLLQCECCNTINTIGMTCLFHMKVLGTEESVLGGLWITCSPRDPRFAGSNPAELDEFFSKRKSPEHKSSGSLRFQSP